MATMAPTARATAVVAAVVAILTHLSGLDAEWTYDDKVALIGNADVTGDGPLADVFLHDFWGHMLWRGDSKFWWSHLSYRPLTVLTFRFNYWLTKARMFGDPMLFHAVNILIHALACAAVIPLLQDAIGRHRPWLVFAAACLFAAHPIHVEVVANVTHRAETLCALLCFLSWWAFRSAVDSHHSVTPLWTEQLRFVALLVAAALLHVMAILAKETAIVFPAVMLVIDLTRAAIHPRRPSSSSRDAHSEARTSTTSSTGVVESMRDLLNDAISLVVPRSSSSSSSSRSESEEDFRVPVWRPVSIIAWTVLAAVVRIRFLTEGYSLNMQTMHNPLSELESPVQRILSFAFVQTFALSLLIWPAHLSHEHNALPPIPSLASPRNLVTVVVWAGVIGIIIAAAKCSITPKHTTTSADAEKSDESDRGDRRQRWRLLTALAITVISYLPASHLLVRVGFVLAERQMFLPSLGACILIAEAIDAIALSLLPVLDLIIPKDLPATDTDEDRRPSNPSSSSDDAEDDVVDDAAALCPVEPVLGKFALTRDAWTSTEDLEASLGLRLPPLRVAAARSALRSGSTSPASGKRGVRFADVHPARAIPKTARLVAAAAIPDRPHASPSPARDVRMEAPTSRVWFSTAVRWSLLLVWLGAFVVRSWFRTEAWMDERSLSRDLLSNYPDNNPMAHYGLGMVHFYAEEWEEAVPHLEAAARMATFAEPYIALSEYHWRVRGSQGHADARDRAIECLEHIEALRSQRVEFWTNLGLLRLAQQTDATPEDYKNKTEWYVLAADVSHVLPPVSERRMMVRINAGLVRLISADSRWGHWELARDHLIDAANHPITSVPKFSAWYNLAVLYGVSGMREQAIDAIARSMQELGRAPPSVANDNAGRIQGLLNILVSDEYRNVAPQWASQNPRPVGPLAVERAKALSAPLLFDLIPF